MIGRGAFGKVYVASHKLNKSEKIALKYIVKRKHDRYLNIDGHSPPLLAEVVMMLRLMKAPSCPNIVRFHDWVENKTSFLLIMEYAESCQTLDSYIRHSLRINENQARLLISQLIRAVKFCAERRVFHGDIHTANILVTTPRLELKLIDFGCAWPVTRKLFHSYDYRGAFLYTPPEILRHHKFHANPAYVWAIGIVLYEILHGDLPFHDRQSVMFGPIRKNPKLSAACQDLISKCMNRSPVKRLKLQQIEEHWWFNPTNPNPVQQIKKRR
ncbi:serine/threonine-protein kinase pim-3-like [Danio aesculapii]|uniref:serine/threonine-protein kinase pim-3-like n=1 Tax=Danio aesculapii TaxID=1142201 RepID=UPI0024BF6BA6|nr:serine/threonine-protein kinase pim-3-like [Danio aesculapii]